MKYSDWLELIIFILLCIMLNSFLQEHYTCEITYGKIMFEYNISNASIKPLYYNKEDTLFILRKNLESSYTLQNLSCKLRFN